MADDYLTANLASYHFNREHAKHLNERNYGIGYEKKLDDLRYMLGLYNNSYGNNSLYGLVGYTPLHYGNLSAGLAGGLVSGYMKYPIPAAGGMLTYENGKHGANLTMIPPATVNGKKTEGFAGLQYKYKLD